MNIASRDLPITEEREDEKEIKCSVCESDFHPDDIYTFVCDECKAKLRSAGCRCGSDDICMDWGIELSDEMRLPPYYWEITCYCGEEIKSRLHDVNEINAVAKEIFAQWITAQEPTK